MAAGDLDGAGGCFVRVLLLDPDHFEARESLGVVHAQRGRDDEARPLLEATLEADPNRPAALYAMGLVLERLGEREQAVTCFARALAVRPDWPQAREALDRLRR